MPIEITKGAKPDPRQMKSLLHRPIQFSKTVCYDPSCNFVFMVRHRGPSRFPSSKCTVPLMLRSEAGSL